MAVTGVSEARDLILGRISTAWAAMAEPSFWPTPGQHWPPAIFWPDVADDVPEAGQQPYAEVEIQHQRGGQVAIGDVGLRRFRSWAVVTVKIVTPYGDGLTVSDYIVKIVKTALRARATPDKVYFRDVRNVDDGRDGGNYKVRVLANVDYDEIG